MSSGIPRLLLRSYLEGLRVHRGMTAEAFRGWLPRAFVDGIYLRLSRGGYYENVALLVASGVNFADDRDAIGCFEGYIESADSCLYARGGAPWDSIPVQRCAVHFCSNVLGRVLVTRCNVMARAKRRGVPSCRSRADVLWHLLWFRLGELILDRPVFRVARKPDRGAGTFLLIDAASPYLLTRGLIACLKRFV